MMKKGQITIFIIVGIVILIAIGSIVMARTKIIQNTVKNIRTDDQTKPIKNYVDNCIKDVSEEGVTFIGKQAGYYLVEENYLKSATYDVPFYYNKGKVTIITKNRIEEEFAKYIDDNLPKCVNFTVFENEGFRIETEEVNSEVEIVKDKVIINIEYQITVEKDDFRKEFKTFNYELKVRLEYIISVFNELVNAVVEDPDAKDLTLFLSFDVDVSTIPYNEEIDVYMIADYKVKVDQKEYIYLFAVRK